MLNTKYKVQGASVLFFISSLYIWVPACIETILPEPPRRPSPARMLAHFIGWGPTLALPLIFAIAGWGIASLHIRHENKQKKR